MILGSDGYMGFPTSYMLAKDKHTIMMIDNSIKNHLMKKHERSPLVRSSLASRVKFIKSINNTASFEKIDCTNLKNFEAIFKKFMPDAVIHYAELPSAPYSMMGSYEAWHTINNNVQSTFNLIWLVKKYNKKCHIIKLGTMGEYGTPNIDIEEGWINIRHNSRSHKFLYPRQASSLYHTTKIMDTDLLWFYTRMNGLRVTDLMQGPVYGVRFTEGKENIKHTATLSYDDIFGTVLNRFIVQAIAGVPLTVYGSGNQVRGYINLIDSLKCIAIALRNPPKPGNLEIFNQFTEQFSVNQLAKKVKTALLKIDIKVEIDKIRNPRNESEKHYYNAKNNKMKELGLKAKQLTDSVIIDIAQHVLHNKNKINKKIISPKTDWK